MILSLRNGISAYCTVCGSFVWLLLRFFCVLINSRVVQGRWVLAVMFLLIKVVSRSRKKVQFVSISYELGSMSTYSHHSLSI